MDGEEVEVIVKDVETEVVYEIKKCRETLSRKT